MPICAYCGRKNRLVQLCSGCEAVNYCNDQCQRKAWPTHKQMCRIAAEPQEELFPGEITPPSYIPSDPFGDVEPLPRRQEPQPVPSQTSHNEQLRADIREAIEGYPEITDRTQVRGLMEHMVKTFNLSFSDEDRVKYCSAILHRQIQEADATFGLQLEAELNRIDADATYRNHFVRYRKKCRKLGEKMARAILQKGMAQGYAFYPELQKVLAYGMLHLRGHGMPLVPSTEEDEVNFAAEIFTQVESAALEEVSPCDSSNGNALGKTGTADVSLGDRTHFEIADPTDPETEMYAQNQAIRDYILETYLPLITDARDTALLYPMVNDQTGEVRMMTREEFNDLQQQNRDHVEYAFANKEKEGREALQDFIEGRIGFKIGVAPQRRGTSKSPTRRSPAARPEQASSSGWSFWNWWGQSKQEPDVQTVSQRGASRAAAAAVNSAASATGRQSALRVPMRVAERVWERSKLDVLKVTAIIGAVAVGSASLIGYNSIVQPSPIAMDPQWKQGSEWVLQQAQDALRSTLSTVELAERYNVALSWKQIAEANALLFRYKNLAGWNTYQELMWHLNSFDKSEWADEDYRLEIANWVYDLQEMPARAADWMLYLLGTEMQRTLDEYKRDANVEPMDVLDGWKAHGFLTAASSAVALNQDLRAVLTPALTRYAEGDPIYEKAKELDAELEKYTVKFDFASLKRATERYIGTAGLSVFGEKALGQALFQTLTTYLCSDVLKSNDNLRRIHEMENTTRREFMDIFSLALDDRAHYDVAIASILRSEPKFNKYFVLRLQDDEESKAEAEKLWNQAVNQHYLMDPTFKRSVVNLQADRGDISAMNALYRLGGGGDVSLSFTDIVDQKGGLNRPLLEIAKEEMARNSTMIQKTDAAMNGFLGTAAYAFENFIYMIPMRFGAATPEFASNLVLGLGIVDLFFGQDETWAWGRVFNARENALVRQRYIGYGNKVLLGALAFHTIDICNLFYKAVMHLWTEFTQSPDIDTLQKMTEPTGFFGSIAAFTTFLKSAVELLVYFQMIRATLRLINDLGGGFLLKTILPFTNGWMKALTAAQHRANNEELRAKTSLLGSFSLRVPNSVGFLVALGLLVRTQTDSFGLPPNRNAILRWSQFDGENVIYNNMTLALKRDLPVPDLVYSAHRFDENWAVRFKKVWDDFALLKPVRSPQDRVIVEALIQNPRWPEFTPANYDRIRQLIDDEEGDFQKTYVPICQGIDVRTTTQPKKRIIPSDIYNRYRAIGYTSD